MRVISDCGQRLFGISRSATVEVGDAHKQVPAPAPPSLPLLDHAL